jgi:hypothetical protein
MNAIIGIVCFAIAVFMYASTLGYPHKSSIGILPGTWPRMIAFLIGIFSVILIIQGIKDKRVFSGMTPDRKTFAQAIVPGIIVVSIILYIIVWSHWRAFILPTFFLMTIIVSLLKQNKKSILDYLISGIIGLVLTAIIYSVFYYVFRLPL